uniref:Uncharacterized protein n=1 Tax=uncultured marine virus TaxID=186617 RepID=A0A0F7L5Y0_9VIRU|nr:hypothetical protein [uncultured marine virus]
MLISPSISRSYEGVIPIPTLAFASSRYKSVLFELSSNSTSTADVIEYRDFAIVVDAADTSASVTPSPSPPVSCKSNFLLEAFHVITSPSPLWATFGISKSLAASRNVAPEPPPLGLGRSGNSFLNCSVALLLRGISLSFPSSLARSILSPSLPSFPSLPGSPLSPLILLPSLPESPLSPLSPLILLPSLPESPLSPLSPLMLSPSLPSSGMWSSKNSFKIGLISSLTSSILSSKTSSVSFNLSKINKSLSPPPKMASFSRSFFLLSCFAMCITLLLYYITVIVSGHMGYILILISLIGFAIFFPPILLVYIFLMGLLLVD